MHLDELDVILQDLVAALKRIVQQLDYFIQRDQEAPKP